MTRVMFYAAIFAGIIWALANIACWAVSWVLP